MAKNVKNNNQGNKDSQVKYSDERMAYCSTKEPMIVKESEKIKSVDVFGDTCCCNSPVVLCEDQNGLYLTNKSVIGYNYLDPYRMYKRDLYEILKEDESFKVRVKISNHRHTHYFAVSHIFSYKDA